MVEKARTEAQLLERLKLESTDELIARDWLRLPLGAVIDTNALAYDTSIDFPYHGMLPDLKRSTGLKDLPHCAKASLRQGKERESFIAFSVAAG